MHPFKERWKAAHKSPLTVPSSLCAFFGARNTIPICVPTWLTLTILVFWCLRKSSVVRQLKTRNHSTAFTVGALIPTALTLVFVLLHRESLWTLKKRVFCNPGLMSGEKRAESLVSAVKNAGGRDGSHGWGWGWHRGRIIFGTTRNCKLFL